MLPMNAIDPEPAPAPKDSGGSGMGAVILGGWLGGLLFAGLLLANGFGWLAELAVRGGALLVLSFALVPLVGTPQPELRPVHARVRRRS